MFSRVLNLLPEEGDDFAHSTVPMFPQCAGHLSHGVLMLKSQKSRFCPYPLDLRKARFGNAELATLGEATSWRAKSP